jgi:hypothetical protein
VPTFTVLRYGADPHAPEYADDPRLRERLVKAGLPPVAALQAATRNPAQFLGRAHAMTRGTKIAACFASPQ